MPRVRPRARARVRVMVRVRVHLRQSGSAMARKQPNCPRQGTQLGLGLGLIGVRVYTGLASPWQRAPVQGKAHTRVGRVVVVVVVE